MARLLVAILVIVVAAAPAAHALACTCGEIETPKSCCCCDDPAESCGCCEDREDADFSLSDCSCTTKQPQQDGESGFDLAPPPVVELAQKDAAAGCRLPERSVSRREVRPPGYRPLLV